jgi:hypothetical protein
MKNLGDTVTINAKYSTYDRMVGVITEVVDQTKHCTVFPYTVQFEDGEENYFSEEELV